MKRGLLFLLIVSVFSTAAFSQVYDEKIEYNKKKQDAFAIEYAYPSEAVENALIKKMGDKGKEEKGLFNKDKGFRVYKGTSVADISSGSMDYAFKIESKGRKDNEKSVIYMIILNKDGENVKPAFAAEDMEKAKSFLNDLKPLIEEANLELQIKDQEEIVAKAEKKLRDLKDDKESMQKKIKKLEDDIKDNEKDQENQQKQIDNQKQSLEALKGKRKNS
jgi:hypothetical protein